MGGAESLRIFARTLIVLSGDIRAGGGLKNVKLPLFWFLALNVILNCSGSLDLEKINR